MGLSVATQTHVFVVAVLTRDIEGVPDTPAHTDHADVANTNTSLSQLSVNSLCLVAHTVVWQAII